MFLYNLIYLSLLVFCYFITIQWTNWILIKSLKIIGIFVNTFISVDILIFKTKVKDYNTDNLLLET